MKYVVDYLLYLIALLSFIKRLIPLRFISVFKPVRSSLDQRLLTIYCLFHENQKYIQYYVNMLWIYVYNLPVLEAVYDNNM